VNSSPPTPTNHAPQDMSEHYLNISGAIILSLDLEGRVLLLNKAGQDILGYSEDEVVGRHWYDFAVPEDMRTDLLKAFQNLIADDASGLTPFGNEVLTKDGDRVYVLWNDTLVHDEHGNIVSVLSSGIDLRHQKRIEDELRESQARLQDFADSTADWFWEMDADLRLSYLSPSLSRVLGISTDQLIGKSRIDLAAPSEMSPLQKKKWDEHLEALKNRQPFRDFEYEHVKVDKSIIHLRTSGKPVFDTQGQFKGYRGTGTDITQERASSNELQLIQNQLYNAIEVMEDGFVLFDAEDRLVICNQRYKEIYFEIADILKPGVTFKEIISAALENNQISSASEDKDKWLQKRLHAHLNPTTPFDQKLSRGGWLRVHERKTADGGIIGLRIDITKEKEEQEERRKLFHAVDQSPNMIIITDDQGVIEYINPSVTKICGYAPDDVIGENPRVLQSGETSPSVYANLWQSILSGHEWKGELKNRRKDGSTFWAHAIISPVKDENGNITHFVSMHEDITRRKEIELRERQAKEQAETANRSKSELLANMSHELRTPLNAILGFSDAMKIEMFGPLGHEKYHDYLNDIHDSGTHLLAIINDILDVSAIEAGAISLHEEAVNLTELIEASVRIVRPRAGASNVTILNHIEPNAEVLFADSRRVKQILLNLLSNAIKFTPQKGQVDVISRISDDGALTLAVHDNGIGMSPKEIQKSLSAFGQVDGGLDRKHEGTGLGLPLTKGLIEAHGGTLVINSKTNQGTQVTAIFPKERVRHMADHEPLTPARV